MTDEKTEGWETEAESAEDKEAKFQSLVVADELISDLPPAAGSLYAETIGKLIELANQSETGGWLRVETGGREANSVQTGLQGAARGLGVKIKTRTRKENGSKVVYVAIATADDADEEADSEE